MPHINAYRRTAPQLLRVASPYRGTYSNGGGRGKKKKNIHNTSPSSPRLWGQREWCPPSYDSRVHGLTRLLGTFPPRGSPFPTRPPFLSVFLSACLPWSSSCFSSAAGPARRGQIQSDRAMLRFPWLVEWSQPWLSSRPGLAAVYEGEAPCWWTWSISISLSSTTQERWSQLRAILSSSPRGWRTRAWPTVGHSPVPGLPHRHIWLLRLVGWPWSTFRDPSAVPSLQMVDGSVVILIVLIVHFLLSLEFLGVRRPV